MSLAGPLLFLLMMGGAQNGRDISRRAEPAPPPRPRRRRPRGRPPGPTPAPAPAEPAPTVRVSTTPTPTVTTPPFPQIVPAGLPPFPGPDWVPDSPPPPAVVARAQQLLPVLWQGGSGTFKIEQVGGRWIAFRATPMGSKKGVVAFRERSPSAPTVTPVSTTPAPAPSQSMGLPTLRQGDTEPPKTGIRTVQSMTGASPIDGKFGPGTAAAVRRFQSTHTDQSGAPLKVDGIVGPKTWGALFAAHGRAS